MITIKTYLLDRFFKSNWNFTSEHVKLVKNSGQMYVRNLIFVFKISQVKGFLGKMATLQLNIEF